MRGAPNNLKQIPELLLVWYTKNARELPWRENTEPYRVWVSEIMLQQTRVEAAKDYYTRFLRELPDVFALAECPDEKLHKLWEGLGYYSRARNMKKAAAQIISEYDGKFPADRDLLLKLPGIGPYTAGAVASIAFGLPCPAVDGNVLRVLSRVTGSRKVINDNRVKYEMEKMVAGIIPKDAAGDFTQALMELGAVVCLPNGQPLCEKCPLGQICIAKKDRLQSEIPVKSPKAKRKIEERTVLIMMRGKNVALNKRADTGLLAGMWELPSIEGNVDEESVRKYLLGRGIVVEKIKKVKGQKHIFTHIEWHMQGYIVEICAGDTGYTWVNSQQLRDEYAIPSAFRGFIRQYDEEIL